MVFPGNLPPPDLLTAAEAAEYLGRPVSWIYHNKHQLPRFRVGHELRFRRSELDAWLETTREGEPAPVLPITTARPKTSSADPGPLTPKSHQRKDRS
jgi:excisionase family DNA binding protein